MNKTKQIQDWLFKNGYAPQGMSYQQFVDGHDGENTRQAVKKARKDGWRYNNKEWYKVNQESSENKSKKQEEPVVLNFDPAKYDSTQYTFKPSKLNGRCRFDECAKWANYDIRTAFPGYYPDVYGDAWTRSTFYGDTDNYISGYDYMTRGMKHDRDNKYNKDAADSLKAHIGEFELIPGEIYFANMYYGYNNRDLPSVGNAAKLGKNYTLGSHTGNIYYDPERSEWMLNHNVHHNVRTVPLISVLGGKGKTGVTAITRVPHIDLLPKDAITFGEQDWEYSQPDYTTDHSYNLFTIFDIPTDPNATVHQPYIHSGTPIYNFYDEDTHLKDYPNGVDVSDLGFYDKKNFKTKANLFTPLVREALVHARDVMGYISKDYNLPINEVQQLYTLLPGILWKESNGGYPMSTRGKNSTYTNSHLNPYHDLGRHLVRGNEVSRGMGSVKMNDLRVKFGPYNYQANRIDENSGIFSGPNTLSKIAQNWAGLKKLFGNNQYLLYDENGNINKIGLMLTTEAHNQGLDKGIKLSYEAYLKDNDIRHFTQYFDPVAARQLDPKNKNKLQNGYAATIYNNVFSRLGNRFYDPALPDFEVDINKSESTGIQWAELKGYNKKNKK